MKNEGNQVVSLRNKKFVSHYDASVVFDLGVLWWNNCNKNFTNGPSNNNYNKQYYSI
ncbi:putative folate synthesis protein [Trichinella spiralis]|uniref:putative folate synthesis protein n=1 Tax=Trichinella spiralis TaxID=6334 RepID=UPI0001EFD3E1|nr:putative folate synthesis protein [Trichinella spiralis]